MNFDLTSYILGFLTTIPVACTIAVIVGVIKYYTRRKMQ